MLEFISDCSGLFTDTFNAAMGQELFAFLGFYIIVRVGFAVFFMFHRGLQKM